MFLRKKGCNAIDLSYVFRISRGKQEDSKELFIKFDFKQETESWNKFFFDTIEDRDEYFENLLDLIEAQEVEVDIISKLK